MDAETWQAANLVLMDPNRRTPRQNTRHLLSGLALCGICGATVHGGASRRPGQRAYRCSGSSGHISRKAEPIEQFVVATLVERLSRPDAAVLLRPDDSPDLDALRSEAAGLRSRLDSLAVDFADGALTSSQLRAATARIRSRLEEVERPLAAAIGGDMLSDLLGADDVTAAWEALSQDRQRAVIAALARVRIKPAGQGARRFDPATVGIEWR
ncbi:hypothetical protein C5E10_05385 [Pseudoclavibacter sp. RFBG4]|uniref:zinc ribbon domain-containing protein n=1 Tax=Pseudoclavibacter sp. RFBG4 TaxID=2080575 RepID=UPI000CE7DB85|nr:zinc ribbon domain-containing protein [Pseudoclavibacter sp. RFBG4]PPG35035.1 hypothetical protein C5E10_05385 [Pseudoclavibacter sp. RFBG4]